MLSWQVSLTVFFVSKAMMSLKTSLAGAATAIGLTALAYPAQAANYSFTYTHGGPTTPIVVTGDLTGTAVGPVITVTGFSNLKYNGTDLSSWTYFNSMTAYVNVDTALPQVSLDNTVTNLFLAFDGNGVDFISFGPDNFGTGTGLAFISDIEGETYTTGAEEEPFASLNFGVKQVPEPSAVVAMLGLGLGALASKVRKQG